MIRVECDACGGAGRIWYQECHCHNDPNCPDATDREMACDDCDGVGTREVDEPEATEAA